MTAPSKLVLQALRHTLLPGQSQLQLRWMSSPKPKSRPNPVKIDKEKSLRLLKRSQIAEYKKQLQDEAKKVHCMKVALRGEALEVEALNPARKRPPREYTPEEIDQQITIAKAYSSFKNRQSAQAYSQLNALVKSRMKAMRRLKKLSPFLYEAALNGDPEASLPLEVAPKAQFPPEEGYQAPEPYDQLFPGYDKNK
eukprot:TRINITY_DN13157_c0_g1_i1.p1 TRINITY_DN13157_c0_g1~~TRINITY_DN13157_c0_g1_i1.p1  ORF type:complete len:196 (+),score=57.98 TRINITY_DN13157_c0_g1_i1:28-615(+)